MSFLHLHSGLLPHHRQPVQRWTSRQRLFKGAVYSIKQKDNPRIFDAIHNIKEKRTDLREAIEWLNPQDQRIDCLNLFHEQHQQTLKWPKEFNAAFLSFTNEQVIQEWKGEANQITSTVVKKLRYQTFSPIVAKGHYADVAQGDDEINMLQVILKRTVEILDPWHLKKVSEMLNNIDNVYILRQIS